MPDTFEAMALAGAQEHYDRFFPGLSRAIALLEKRRSETHDSNIRYGLGISIDLLRKELQAL